MTEETGKRGSGRVPLYFATQTEVETVLATLQLRIERLEEALHRLETDRAVFQEKEKYIEGRFNQLDTRLDKIDGHVSRLVWLVFATIIGGFMSFVMRGGVFGG